LEPGSRLWFHVSVVYGSFRAGFAILPFPCLLLILYLPRRWMSSTSRWKSAPMDPTQRLSIFLGGFVNTKATAPSSFVLLLDFNLRLREGLLEGVAALFFLRGYEVLPFPPPHSLLARKSTLSYEPKSGSSLPDSPNYLRGKPKPPPFPIRPSFERRIERRYLCG